MTPDVLPFIGTCRRICIVGGPRTGKTTLADELAESLGLAAFHTDELIASHTWSGVSDSVEAKLRTPEHLLVEGVAVVRGLRKFLALPDSGCGGLKVIALRDPKVTLTDAQRTMARGHHTILCEIMPELHTRGVPLLFLP